MKVNKQAKTDFFKIVTQEGSDTADILLYGVIGQEDWTGRKPEQEMTAVAFKQAFQDLEKNHSTINVRVNSPGGSMLDGNAIITAIQSSTADVHVWNDGMAASMAADIWLAAKKENRHMAKNALLMIHSPSSMVWGTAKKMREQADVLDKFEATAIAVMVDATGMSEEDVKEKFYDYEDHWLTAKEVQDLGFVSKVEDLEAEGIPQDASKMSYEEVMNHFIQKNDKEAQGWLTQIKEKIGGAFTKRMAFAKSYSSTNNDEVNLDTLKKAVVDGDITMEQLTAEFNLQAVPALPATPAPAPPVVKTAEEILAEKISEAVQGEIAPVKKENEALKAEIEKLKAAPATPPAGVAAEGDDYAGMSDAQKTAEQELEELNELFYKEGRHGFRA